MKLINFEDTGVGIPDDIKSDFQLLNPEGKALG
jgi:hypothetical protein